MPLTSFMFFGPFQFAKENKLKAKPKELMLVKKTTLKKGKYFL